MFEEAVRRKYRFESQYGLLSTEDLWDLGFTSLNDVSTRISTGIYKGFEEEKKLALIKYIIKVLKEEAAHKLSILALNQNEQSQELSMEELQARTQELTLVEYA